MERERTREKPKDEKGLDVLSKSDSQAEERKKEEGENQDWPTAVHLRRKGTR